jgi:hypothetical protein
MSGPPIKTPWWQRPVSRRVFPEVKLVSFDRTDQGRPGRGFPAAAATTMRPGDSGGGGEAPALTTGRLGGEALFTGGAAPVVGGMAAVAATMEPVDGGGRAPAARTSTVHSDNSDMYMCYSG